MVIFKPSAISEYISTLPIELQERALQVIVEEEQRWKQGKLTPEELKSREIFEKLGHACAKSLENIAIKAFTGDK